MQVPCMLELEGQGRHIDVLLDIEKFMLSRDYDVSIKCSVVA